MVSKVSNASNASNASNKAIGNTGQRVAAYLINVLALLGFGLATYWMGLLHANKADIDQTRLWVLCGLLAIISLSILAAHVQKIIRLSIPPIREITPPPPSVQHTQRPAQSTDAVDPADSTSTEQFDSENQLEHAPIALFSVKSHAAVHPLNAHARRLLAPGRVTEKNQFFDSLKSLKQQGRALIEFETERGIERALVANNQIILQGESVQVIALMPVESELQLEAQNAWLKLLRVLIHEINNSLTPVASLSRTASELLEHEKALFEQSHADGAYRDLQTALEAIHRRSSGLSDFVNHTRDLTNLKPAHPQRIALATLFAQLESLFAPSWKNRGGSLTWACEPQNLEVIVDPLQLEQALINLIQNAYDATANTSAAHLDIQAALTHGSRLKIEITDNGKGINEEHLSHIFTPFFTTKDKGSGIGLALTRQLIQNNNGTVRYAQSVKGGARFIITL